MTSCCPENSWPFLVDNYQVKGSNIQYEGMNIYTVGEPGEKAVVLLADIFGFESSRHRAIADHFAEQGYFAIVPDMFRGDPIVNYPEDFPNWAPKFTWEGFQQDFQNVVIPYLSGVGVQSAGLMGFCWGGWLIFKLCADEAVDTSIIKCGVHCHPSPQVEELVFQSDPLLMARQLKDIPQLILSAGNDTDYVKPGAEYEKILTERNITCVTHHFPDQSHGWVVRGDLTIPETDRDVKLALEKSLEFFKEML
eukprot:TRINITY_DN12967_c0_g1_i1.p1 TRINITY_DN12967_c0_g1~~TRINITY_DN12967_c0_g1_i1.p1  ORF type:complete len:251 (+),score=49.95 TRINITY_DN12967_c0_g1_i1:44-796(+)